MKKNLKVFLVLLVIVPFLQGCWNQEELPNLAFVMALGIDKADHNQGYKVTFEIVNAGNVASTQMGGGQGPPIAVYKSTGKTVFEAARNASKELSRKIYFAHTNAVVVSEQVAKDGIYDLLDTLDRDPVFRTTTQFFVARNSSAEKVVSTLTILDKIPVYKLVKTMDVTGAMLGENTKITIDDIIYSIATSGKEPFANGVVLTSKLQKGKTMSNIASDNPDVIVKIDGLALFKGGKLNSWIDGQRSRGVVWVLNKVKGTDVFIDWQGKKKAIGIIIRRSNVKVSPSTMNGQPSINVSVKVEGDVEQVNGSVDITNPATIKKFEDMYRKEITKEVSDSIKAVQAKKTDIFGFGEYIHRDYPEKWKKIKSNWDQQFASIEVSVNADVYLRRNGIRNKSFWSNINQ